MLKRYSQSASILEKQRGIGYCDTFDTICCQICYIAHAFKNSNCVPSNMPHDYLYDDAKV